MGAPSLAAASIELQDFQPGQYEVLREVLQGLRQPQKSLPCKLFYDEQGSQLFDRICELKEYYLTRTEVAILREHGGQMASLLGPGCVLVEYGSGSSLKTRLLLDHLPDAAAYVPIDISREHLLRSARRLSEAYPGLRVLPVCADYTGEYELPDLGPDAGRRSVYFPGSTVGNLAPAEALGFLRHIAEACGPGGGLLIGVDLQKDIGILEAAYNDSLGVTAQFNLNLLSRLNRDLGADFRLEQFAHHAFYNARQSRIEMHLVSLRDQAVHLAGHEVLFGTGETILTEYSHKYTVEGFGRLAHEAGFTTQAVWTDPDRLFSVHYLRRRETSDER